MDDTAHSPTTLVDRIRKLRDALGEGLIERETPIRLALLAAFSGEHLLLIGPPGTAKSELARRLRHAFADTTYFERLLTKFTVPEELFGPLSIKELERDRYYRQTKGYLPEASVAFLDEIFKANSAILNALLTLLNERLFDNGDERKSTPLIAVIGASNELPEQREQLDALYDRFLFRCHVAPVSASAFPSLLALRGDSFSEPTGALRFKMAELKEVQQAAAKVVVPDEVMQLLAKLREFLHAQKIEVSDRRWRKIVKTLQVSAYTNGRNEVSRWDCWLLQHCTWTIPEQRLAIQKWYEERMGTASEMDPSQFVRLISQLEAKLKDEQGKTEHARNEKGEPLYVQIGTAPLHTTSAKGKRQVPDGSNYNRMREEEYDLPPFMQPMQYPAGYIRNRVADVSEIEQALTEFLAEVDEHMASIAAQVNDHTWIAPGFAEPAKRVLQQTRNSAAALNARLSKLKLGFEGLPRTKSDVDVASTLSARRPK